MFEQILGQSALTQLESDITSGILAPSMLFSGTKDSGKGSAGLELARIISCEKDSIPVDCNCNACVRHKLLTHPDLLTLGSRNFSSEISASLQAFIRKPESPETRLLFVRSVRKLLARFSPILWEDEPKFGKLVDSIMSLEEGLDEIWASEEFIKKRCDAILKTALKLEADGISDQIPINQIRKASAWSRLAPIGKRKMLLIENADRMQDAAKNSLLKILEEPPPLLIIVLTTSREKALLPTILSRVRVYRFVKRSQEIESEVIKTIFKDEFSSVQEISLYLDFFLPVSKEKLRPLTAFFTNFIATEIVFALRKNGISNIPDEIIALGKYSSAILSEFSLEKPIRDVQSVISKVIDEAEKFEIRGLFSDFLNVLLNLVSESLKEYKVHKSTVINYCDIWRRRILESANAVGIYNQNPAIALDRFCTEICRDMCNSLSDPFSGF